jgi:hypothetical protein
MNGTGGRHPRAAALFLALWMTVLASLPLAANASGAQEIAALETEWINMGMMGPGDVSRHRVEIDRRALEIRHSISINGAETQTGPRVYRFDAAAGEDFFGYLEKQRPDRWEDDYSVPMLDGWAWRLRVLYKGGPEKRIEGNETPPPGGEEIERRIRALAPFAPEPYLF